MFEGFTDFDISVHSSPPVTIHGKKGGSGPPLLLLHGFPQTLHIWHLVVPHLINDFSVVVIDIRGYGASSKPSATSEPSNNLYAKSLMAVDCKKVMEELGHDRFYVCAHDRGARVAHKLCVDHPSLVLKAIFLDICPTLAMYLKTDFDFASAYFHWFLLIQKNPFPEMLISQNPKLFVEHFMGSRHAGLEVFNAECLAHYTEVMQNPDAVHAMCEDYRASATVDMDEARKDVAAKRHIQCPLRVLWGKYGVIENSFDAIKEWKEVSTSVVDGHNVDCGHYIPEEAPSVVVDNIKHFFA